VALLARHGFKTWGLEISQGAVDAANENVKSYLDSATSPHAEVVLGDFFQKDIDAYLGQDFQGFDLIYDYTVSLECRFRSVDVLRMHTDGIDLVLVCPTP
jgi:hypothetical protein